MQSIFRIGSSISVLVMLISIASFGQDNGQEKPSAKPGAKEARVRIVLKSGEVIGGTLVKIDSDSVEIKVNDVLQSIPTEKVSNVRFGEADAPKAVAIFGSPNNLPVLSGTAPVPISVPEPPVIKPNDPTGPAPMSANLKPTILYKEKAQYTREARDHGVQGTVVLSVVFTAEGQITQIRVIRGLPDGLTEKAIEAARKIRFSPAVKNGQAVSVRGNLEFTFNLYTSLPAPEQLAPKDSERLKQDPAKLKFEWKPVEGAVRYQVKIEVESAKAGEWIFEQMVEVTEPTSTLLITGPKTRRWKVLAIDTVEREGYSSEWRTFRFTK